MPVLLSGGWSVSAKSLRPAARELFAAGRPAILINHAREGGPTPSNGGYPAELVHKADTILKVIDELGIAKVDSITQSEGAITTAIAAANAPEKFRTLILEAPAGLSGEDTRNRLIGRFALKTGIMMSWDLFVRHPIAAPRFLSGSGKYIRKAPKKSLREVEAIATTPINSILDQLRAAGIKVGVIQSRADKGFSHKKIYEQLVHQNDEDLDLEVDAYASIANRWAGHDHVIFNAPQAIKSALQMIDNFGGRSYKKY